jgi:DNA topoisomerase I
MPPRSLPTALCARHRRVARQGQDHRQVPRRGYTVKATVGHVRDLPAKKLGIDIDNGFEPEYVTIEGKEKTSSPTSRSTPRARAKSSSPPTLIAKGRRSAGTSNFFTSSPSGTRVDGADPPRALPRDHQGRRAALHRPSRARSTASKVDAQQARRVLDRLVGYKASPVLWKTVKKGLSAGRVQTVALRLIVEREREIRAFTPVEYWTIAADLQKGRSRSPRELHQIVDGKKPEIPESRVRRDRILADLQGRKEFVVTEVKRRERRKNPRRRSPRPRCSRKPPRSWASAPSAPCGSRRILYEGIELGGEGSVGLITYMRTDSSRGRSAASPARDYLRGAVRRRSTSPRPQLYPAPRRMQRAGRARRHVRPTDPARRPRRPKYLTADQFKLYS